MPFDISTAKAVQINEKKAFDPSTAKPIEESPQEVLSRIPGMDQSVVPETPHETSLTDKAIGIRETGLSLLSGATTGAAHQIVNTLQSLAEQILTGKFGTPEAANLVEQAAAKGAETGTYAPRTESGQQYAENIGNVLEPLQAVAPQLAVDLAPMTSSARSTIARPKGAIKAPIQSATETLQKSISSPESVRLLESMPQTGKLATIAETIKKNPYDVESAGYRLIGNTAVKDPIANEAIKQGFKPGVIATIKASSPKDIKQMEGMLNIFKIGKKSERFRAENRPADILGKTIEERVKFIADANKKAGNEVNAAAQSLKNKTVNYEPAINKFISDLEDIGVRIEPTESGGMKAILKGSDIEGDAVSKSLLNRILSRLSDTDVPRSGYDLHRAKQFIDTQVEYGKKSKNALSGKTERIVKNLRRNLNEALKESSSEYKAANEKYSATIDALNDFKNTVGSKVNIDSPNIDKALGTASRKLLSNYQNRVQMIDALDKLENTAKNYGMKIDDNIINQLIAVNELDRMFGAPADMTFKGQISQAMQTGVQAARSTLADNAINLAKTGIEKVRGINEENAIKAFEQLLNRESKK